MLLSEFLIVILLMLRVHTMVLTSIQAFLDVFLLVALKTAGFHLEISAN